MICKFRSGSVSESRRKQGSGSGTEGKCFGSATLIYFDKGKTKPNQPFFRAAGIFWSPTKSSVLFHKKGEPIQGGEPRLLIRSDKDG